MFIEPNTKIRLLKSVPLDTSYKHTLYFGSASEQANYFISLTKYNMDKYTYQRVQKGSARVGIKADLLYDCNYMMFQNTSFGTKWFYAFITGVEYINNEVSEITFEIDVMQTWYFDYSLRECFVEREHSETDVIGENLVPENLEHGEYVSDDFDGTGKIRDYKIVIAATIEEEGYNVTGGHYAGIYSGLYLNVFDNYAGANEWIDGVVAKGKTSGIVSVFMMPSAFITGIGDSAKSYELVKTKQVTSIDGYVPRNKKLFTFPYNFLYVSNLNGNSAVFQYEFFSSSGCAFTIAGDFSCNPNVVLYPMNYKGVPANIDERLTIGGFPQCSWNSDAYAQWLAQSGPSTFVNSMVGVAGSMLTGNVVGAVRSVTGALGQIYEHAIMPRQAHVSGGSTTQVALGIKDFAFMHKHIKKEFAQIIDEYFDMYGYATHRVKKPNISSRPHWNYVKTIDCTIVGSLPADDITKICGIYDKGITFWKSGTEVGNYSLNNSPTATSGVSEISEVDTKEIESEVSVSNL